MRSIEESSHRTQRGFTLIELVIAVSILAVIMSIAYSSLSYIMRTKQLLDDRREIASIANAVLLRVSREIQLASPTRLIPPASGAVAGRVISQLEGVQKTLDNGNRGDSLDFMAQEAGQYVPEGMTNSGTVQIGYRVEKDPDSPKGAPSSYLLIRDEKPDIRPPKRAWSKLMTFPIAKNVTRLEFSYYDVNGNKWLNEWVNQTGLPALVRMVVTLRSPAGVEHEFVTVLPVA